VRDLVVSSRGVGSGACLGGGVGGGTCLDVGNSGCKLVSFGGDFISFNLEALDHQTLLAQLRLVAQRTHSV
jgi:hypothetical protein